MKMNFKMRTVFFFLALALVIVGFSIIVGQDERTHASTRGISPLRATMGRARAASAPPPPAIRDDDQDRDDEDRDQEAQAGFDREIRKNLRQMFRDGRRTFRFDTFGDEDFWGGQLRLHQAIEGANLGGVGPGVSPRTALAVGLKVDVDALPRDLVEALQKQQVNLNDPATTLALLKLNAVVGVTGFFNEQGTLRSMGIQCALCHSIVDDSFAQGIGHRLDGWANRDLNVGAIVALAPNLQPVVELFKVVSPNASDALVRDVLNSWGPGKFDAEVFIDGKSQQPNGRSAATLIPPAFGLAGVNLHTWTGWGSVTYWNAFVAVLEMHGKGRFFDPRLRAKNPDGSLQFPIAAAKGFNDVMISPERDQVTPKLAALHFYQLGLPAPKPPEGSFDEDAAERGKVLFNGRARCARCHVPPLFTEPGWNLHGPFIVFGDAFQANRAPDRGYRTSPLKGLWTHQKGGFFHDGRLPTLLDVMKHYNRLFSLNLSDSEMDDLVQYMLSL